MDRDEAPTIGARYHVMFDDCCVAGEFTAAVVEVRCDSPHPDDVDFVTAIGFDNGVTLTGFLAVGFEPVMPAPTVETWDYLIDPPPVPGEEHGPAIG